MKRFGRKSMFGAIGTLVAIGIGAALLGAVGIVGWEYTNSDEFCAVMCHSVHPEESRAHNDSAHARVHCVECHMGRNSTLKLIAMKPTHFKELWGMIVGYERPIHASGLRPAREACETRAAAVDERLVEAARAAAGDALLSSLADEAVRELAPFRSRLAPGAWDQALGATVDRLLRDRFGLPTI